jgi:uncharacterized membrane protein
LRGVLVILVLTSALGVSSSAPAPRAAPVVRYTVTDLGTLGGARSEACGMNDAGLVVGWSELAGGIRHPFLYFPHGYLIRATGQYVPDVNGRPKMLDLLAGQSAAGEARAVNRAGVVVGFSLGADGGRQAMVWEGFFAKRLGPGGAFAINDPGLVAGEGVLWDAASGRETGRFENPTATGTPSQLEACAIANSGQIVGAEWFDSTHGTTRPFLWQRESFQVLAAPAAKGLRGAAYAINEQGQIAGTDGQDALLWQKGAVMRLSGLGSLRSAVARGINDAGQVVGRADISHDDQAFRAVLWEKGLPTDLNPLLPPNSGWTLEEARAINHAGMICGTGSHDGKRHAFLLVPMSRPPGGQGGG